MSTLSELSVISKMRLANKAGVAEFFDVSIASVDSWIRRGCPYVQEGRQGQPWEFDLLRMAEWRFAGKTTSTGEIDPEKMSPKERLEYYRGTRERMAVERDAKNLLPADDVVKGWIEILKTLKGRLIGLPREVAPRLIGVDNIREVEKIIGEHINIAMDEISAGNGNG